MQRHRARRGRRGVRGRDMGRDPFDRSQGTNTNALNSITKSKTARAMATPSWSGFAAIDVPHLEGRHALLSIRAPAAYRCVR